MLHLLTEILRNSILITGLVVIMMMMIESLNIESRGLIFKGLKIIAEETTYIGAEYNTETRRLEEMPKTIVQYYAIPGGVKKLPMYSYRESMSRTVELIRKAEKEGEDESK